MKDVLQSLEHTESQIRLHRSTLSNTLQAVFGTSVDLDSIVAGNVTSAPPSVSSSIPTNEDSNVRSLTSSFNVLLTQPPPPVKESMTSNTIEDEDDENNEDSTVPRITSPINLREINSLTSVQLDSLQESGTSSSASSVLPS